MSSTPTSARLIAGAIAGSALVWTPLVHAGAKIAIDDTKWVSIGAGARALFTTSEDSAPDGDWSKDFALDSARIYINGAVTKHIGFTLNTECTFCQSEALRDFNVIDAIAKFEFSPYFNIWAGRTLVPSDRHELNGPYYSPMFEPYKTPFYSADFSTDYGTGGAGLWNRDHGVVVWGAAGPSGAFQYSAGVFNGLESSTGVGPNQDDSLLFAGRVAYNFLSVESNPGYYTSGTYYGGGGDILTLAYAIQHQSDGAGSFANPGDLTAMNVDVLFEKVLPGKGVVTLDGEYKHFDADYDAAAFADADCFCMFDGDSFAVAGFYLFPQQIGWGKFQPYARYSYVDPNDSTDRDEIEGGLNYIIDGHNARISMFYQHGDIATEGLNYAPTLTDQDEVGAFKIAFQLQI